MDNESKISKEQINSIISNAKNGNTDTDELMKKHLNEEQLQKVKSILSDPERLRQLMQSPIAQQFMKAMKENRDNN